MQTQNLELRTKNYKSKVIRSVFCILFTLLAFSFSLFAFGVSQIRAQSLSLSISPPTLEIMIKPGKSITQVFKISNQGDPAVIMARIVKYDENGLVTDNQYVPEKWIGILNSDILLDRPFLLSAGEEKKIVLRINPPGSTQEMDYYRALIFTTVPNPALETSQSWVSTTVGSIILISVTQTGNVVKSGQISSFSLPTIIDSFGPLTGSIEVKNTGNTFFRPIGDITLTGDIGRGTYKIIPQIILPGQKRIIHAELPDSSSNKQGTLFLPGFYLGRYHIFVSFSLDSGNIVVEQTKTFYALPWKIAIAGIILFAIYYIWKRVRMRRNSKSKAHDDAI